MATPFLGLNAPVVLAHQGFAPDGGANTLEAFTRAEQAGADVLETDVHVSSDGVPLAFHDDELGHGSTGTGRLDRHTWAELQQIRVDGRPLVSIADLLARMPQARFNIDVKSAAAVEPFAKVLAAAEAARPGTLERICVASFSDRRRRDTLAALGHRVTCSAGRTTVTMLWLGSRAGLLNPLARLAARHVDALQVPERVKILRVVDRRFVDTAHRHGLVVHVWTVNDAEAMRRLLDLGVDGIVTDRTDAAVTVLRDRRRG